jgi:ribosomal protein S18 acetylase RimI-like enzyme
MQDAAEQEGAGATPVRAGEVTLREAVPGRLRGHRPAGSARLRRIRAAGRPAVERLVQHARRCGRPGRRRHRAGRGRRRADRRHGHRGTGPDDRGSGNLDPGQANFQVLAVDPVARGCGVGQRLVEACVQVARRAAKDLATLHTTDQMAAAQRIYRSLGFQRDPSHDIELRPDLVLRAFRLPLRAAG